MTEELGCQYAHLVSDEAVGCGLVESLLQLGCSVQQIDYFFTGMKLYMSTNPTIGSCGASDNITRERCVGACVNNYNFRLLLSSVRENIILNYPENELLLTRLVAARYFED